MKGKQRKTATIVNLWPFTDSVFVFSDEDMQSMISLMSVNNCSDIAPLDDLEDIPDLESSGDISEHVIDFTQQLEQLTSSLNSPEPQTPKSVPSLTEDPTPIVESINNVINREPEKPQRFETVAEIASLPRDTDTSDKIDASFVPKRAGMAFPEELESLAKQEREKQKEKLTSKAPSSLFHSFNFKEEKPAPLASPEQDKMPEKDPDPPKLVHKPPEIKKRIELLPLNLKKSYDYDAEKDLNQKRSELDKPRTGTLGRDKTPGQDLLEWCKDVTKVYENVKVTNLTTSFKNGMAFAAIIAYHRPDLMWVVIHFLPVA